MLISTDSYGTESLQHPIRPAHLNVNASLFRFWGKTRPCESVHGPKWHPLVFHSLDMAAVGEALLGRDRGAGCGPADLLGLQQDAATRVICFLLCLHDIGKFAKKFQAKAPTLYPDCFGDDPSRLFAYYDHGA